MRHLERRALRLAMSDVAIKFATKLPAVRLPLVQSLRDRGQWAQQHPGEQAALPKDTDLQVLEVTYCDFLFIENLWQLEKGFAALQRRFPTGIFGRMRMDDFASWLSSARQRVGGGAMFNALTLLFKDTSARSRAPRTIESTRFWLVQPVPSFVAFCASCTPSKSFQDAFQRLITSDVPTRIEITRFSLRRGVLAARHHTPRFVRRDRIRGLLKTMDREVVQILSPSVQGELSKGGHLPSVVFYSVKGREFAAPHRSTLDGFEPPHSQLDFWDSLDLSARPTEAYANGWLTILPGPNGETGQDRFRALVLSDRYPQPTAPGQDPEMIERLRYRCLEVSASLAALVPVATYLRRAISTALQLRDKLASSLHGHRSLFLPNRTIRRALGVLGKLNLIAFSCERLTEGLDEPSVKWIWRDVGCLELRTFTPGFRRSTLLTDLLGRIDYLSRRLQGQLALLRNSFREFVDLRLLAEQRRTQRLILALTVLLLLVSALLLLPEAERWPLLRRIWATVRSLLSGLFL